MRQSAIAPSRSGIRRCYDSPADAVWTLWSVGGPGTLNRSVAATRTRGTVALVGGVEGFAAELEIMSLLAGAKRLMGIVVGSRTMFEDLNRFVAAARIRPVMAERMRPPSLAKPPQKRFFMRLNEDECCGILRAQLPQDGREFFELFSLSSIHQQSCSLNFTAALHMQFAECGD